MRHKKIRHSHGLRADDHHNDKSTESVFVKKESTYINVGLSAGIQFNT
jgi:hypothetical protein